jgi:hypothetical protein
MYVLETAIGVPVTHNTNKATAQGHDGHSAGHALQEYILYRRKGEAKVPSEELKDTESHETGWHGHNGHPSRLQSKVHIGEADDGSNAQSSQNGPHGEAVTRDLSRRHAVYVALAIARDQRRGW